jgi:hypothetical protein
MKALIIATDLIKTVSGDIKVLETNTNALLNYQFNDDIAYLNNLTEFIQTNQFQTVHCIYPTASRNFNKKLKEICESLNIQIVEHLMDAGSVTVPYIEDSEDILIIRISYDTTAIIDEDYCKDKFKLQTIINNKAYGSKTFIPNELDNFESIPDFEYSDDVPNFIVKKRLPNYDKEVYPKLYKIQNLTELNDLKATVESDCYLQEFHHSQLVEGKRCVIRSFDLLYGSNLDVLHICSFYKTNQLAENQWENTFNESGLLSKKDRPKYITSTNEGVSSNYPYVYDVDQELVMGDGGRKTFNQLQIGDSVKTVYIDGLDLDERTYTLNEWVGNYNDFVSNIYLKESQVTYKYTSPLTSQLFLRVTLDDGVTEWDELEESPLLVKVGETVVFKSFGSLQIGDSIVTFNFETNLPEIKNIQSIEVIFKEDQLLGSMDVEPEDVYMPLVSQYITIIQHNACNKGCKSAQCGNAYLCGDCTPQQCGPQK